MHTNNTPCESVACLSPLERGAGQPIAKPGALLRQLGQLSRRGRAVLASARGLLKGLLLVACLGMAGCSSLVANLTSQLAADLADAILNSKDVDTVREGVPAYLLMIDSFVAGSPESVDLLLAASELNGAFSALVEDDERIKLLTSKSLAYADTAVCSSDSVLCNSRGQSFQRFSELLTELDAKDVPLAYSLGVAWVSWIQAHSDDWTTVSELGKAKALMSRLVELDESWENGGPHLYLGGMETLLPASLGGRPDKGRKHFEKAIAISDQYLMSKVIFAEQYARLVFDQSLHDRLLAEVLAADAEAPGMTLVNRIAQARAKALLETSQDYF